jgi:oligoribonuclease NrnB/cAMP/cGMP phosphodiesterase (DHH superfamily)
MDGRCSAAIVRYALGANVRLHAMDYGDPVPWAVIEAADKVIIVDFSLTLDDMLRIDSRAELVWIDHHKTSLEALERLNQVAGLRGTDDAACVLTWLTFFPDGPVPDAVKYIGDRDMWRFAFEETASFCEGLYQEETDPSNDELWKALFEGETDLINILSTRGQVLRRARLRRIERRIERSAFEVTFEGHRTLAINLRGTGEIGEHIRKLGYEIGYCFHEALQNGSLTTFVTLYSDQVDVSEIASRFGGGGHEGAAGFSLVRGGTPFPETAKVSR